MKKKLLFALGAAVGYVIGTRTGRQGYTKLKGQVGAVWQKPAVQDGIVYAEVFAEEKIPVVGSAVSAAVQSAADSVSHAVEKNDESSSPKDVPSADDPSADDRSDVSTPRHSNDTPPA